MSDMTRRDLHRPRKRKRRNRRMFRWIVLPLLLITLSVVAYGAHLFSKAETVANESYQPVERESKRENINPFEENISVLLIGVDDSENRQFEGNSRTDALMVATFNKDDKSIKLLSIPRDSYVYIPDKGYYDKINHAHAYGGVELTLETVEELLDVPIDYYVKMNFNAFIDVIDALGGINVNVPYALNEQDSNDVAGAIRLEEGPQTLDGEEALALARTRKQDSDIERGKRQQEIIKAVIKKAASLKSVTNYTDVIEAVGENMTTDLRFNEMTSFVDYALAGTNLQAETLNLVGGDAYINGVYYYQLDENALDETQRTLQSHLGLLDEPVIGSETDSETDDSTNSNTMNETAAPSY